MSTLIAGVGDADLSGREFVGETEEAAVRTGVGAETFRSQEINGHKTTDKKERDRDGDSGKSFPEIIR